MVFQKKVDNKVKEIKIKDPLNAMRYKHIPTFTTIGADVTMKEMNEII